MPKWIFQKISGDQQGVRGNRLVSKHSFWEQSLDIEDALIANQSSFSILIFLFFSLFSPFNEQDRICCNNKWATLVRSKQKPPKNSRSSTSSVEFDAKTFFFLEKARTRDLRIQRRDKANFSPTLRNSVGNCGKLVHVWSLMTSSSLVWQLLNFVDYLYLAGRALYQKKTPFVWSVKIVSMYLGVFSRGGAQCFHMGVKVLVLNASSQICN